MFVFWKTNIHLDLLKKVVKEIPKVVAGNQQQNEQHDPITKYLFRLSPYVAHDTEERNDNLSVLEYSKYLSELLDLLKRDVKSFNLGQTGNIFEMADAFNNTTISDTERRVTEQHLFQLCSSIPNSVAYSSLPDKKYPESYLSKILIDNFDKICQFNLTYGNLTLTNRLNRFLVNLIYSLQFWEVYHLIKYIPNLQSYLLLLDFKIFETSFGTLVLPPENYLVKSMYQGFQYPFPYPFYNYSYHPLEENIKEKYSKVHIKPYIDISLKDNSYGKKRQQSIINDLSKSKSSRDLKRRRVSAGIIPFRSEDSSGDDLLPVNSTEGAKQETENTSLVNDERHADQPKRKRGRRPFRSTRRSTRFKEQKNGDNEEPEESQQTKQDPMETHDVERSGNNEEIAETRERMSEKEQTKEDTRNQIVLPLISIPQSHIPQHPQYPTVALPLLPQELSGTTNIGAYPLNTASVNSPLHIHQLQQLQHTQQTQQLQQSEQAHQQALQVQNIQQALGVQKDQNDSGKQQQNTEAKAEEATKTMEDVVKQNSTLESGKDAQQEDQIKENAQNSLDGEVFKRDTQQQQQGGEPEETEVQQQQERQPHLQNITPKISTHPPLQPQSQHVSNQSPPNQFAMAGYPQANYLPQQFNYMRPVNQMPMNFQGMYMPQMYVNPYTQQYVFPPNQYPYPVMYQQLPLLQGQSNASGQSNDQRHSISHITSGYTNEQHLNEQMSQRSPVDGNATVRGSHTSKLSKGSPDAQGVSSSQINQTPQTNQTPLVPLAPTINQTVQVPNVINLSTTSLTKPSTADAQQESNTLSFNKEEPSAHLKEKEGSNKPVEQHKNSNEKVGHSAKNEGEGELSSSEEFSEDEPYGKAIRNPDAPKKRNHRAKLPLIHQCHLTDPQTFSPCMKIFYGRNELLRHQEFVHATRKKIFKCVYCAKESPKVQSYPRHDSLARHIRRKHGVTGKENKLAVNYAKQHVVIVEDPTKTSADELLELATKPLPHPEFLADDYSLNPNYTGFLLFSTRARLEGRVEEEDDEEDNSKKRDIDQRFVTYNP